MNSLQISEPLTRVCTVWIVSPNSKTSKGALRRYYNILTILLCYQSVALAATQRETPFSSLLKTGWH